MLILTELDDHGKPIVINGAIKNISSANEFYDDLPAKASDYLKVTMREMTAADPERRLAIVRTEYHILHRNHEPVNPC